LARKQKNIVQIEKIIAGRRLQGKKAGTPLATDVLVHKASQIRRGQVERSASALKTKHSHLLLYSDNLKLRG
jgi:hypothetical protein